MPKIIDNESDRLDTRVTFNMTKTDHESLIRIAKNQRVPFGQILRELVRVYLKGIEPGKAITRQRRTRTTPIVGGY